MLCLKKPNNPICPKGLLESEDHSKDSMNLSLRTTEVSTLGSRGRPQQRRRRRPDPVKGTASSFPPDLPSEFLRGFSRRRLLRGINGAAFPLLRPPSSPKSRGDRDELIREGKEGGRGLTAFLLLLRRSQVDRRSRFRTKSGSTSSSLALLRLFLTKIVSFCPASLHFTRSVEFEEICCCDEPDL